MIELSAKQKDFILHSDARLNIAIGSVRAGKSYAGMIRWLKYIQEAPKGNLIMVGRTSTTIKRNIIDEMFNLVGDDARYYIGKSELTLWGRRIYLVGCSDERAEQKIRGLTASGAFVDEATLISEPFFTMLLSRLSVPGAKLFATTNPDSPFHYLKKNYIDRKDELDLKTWEFKLDDNPSLTELFKENLKKEYRGLWYKRFIEGEWVLAEGVIYDFFDEALHTIIDPGHSAIYYIVGIDYGTTNPCAFSLIGYNPNNYPNIWVEQEYYYNPAEHFRQKTDTEFAEDLKKFIEGKNVKAIYIDPSAASFKAELSRQGVREVFDANNEVLDGIRFVANLFCNGTLKIGKVCRNLIKELSSYAWDTNAAQKGIEKPLKKDDHLSDSLRYSLFSHFNNRLKSEADMSIDRLRALKSEYTSGSTLGEHRLPSVYR